MALEEGNVGGQLWDRDHDHGQRPQGGGKFPKIEDAARQPRSEEKMAEEAWFFREQMRELDL